MQGFLKRDFVSFIDVNVIDRSAEYGEACEKFCFASLSSICAHDIQ